MTKKLEELVNNLEGCNGVFDYLIEPNDAESLVSYIKELQQENKDLKAKYLKAVTDYEETKSKIEKANATIDTHNELIEHLGNKIDKVIDIIECSRWDNDMYDISADGINNILEILKDSDVNE